MSGIGHNRGPSLEPGTSWRAECWRRARANLLPVLPVEVVRLRVRRAKEIGLDYRTYAGVRAATGHDLVAFLFSTNALRACGGPLDPGRTAKLRDLRDIGRRVAVQAPFSPEGVARILSAAGVEALTTGPAPRPDAGWREVRDGVLALTGTVPPDRILMIGAAPWERGWAEAGRLAGYVEAERYFGG
jgi:hypothetical protein